MIRKNNSLLCLIPARGGSKRLIDKNVVLLRDKPLIIYTIEAALQSGLTENVYVTTDHEGIAGISEKAGARLMPERPAYLSSDEAFLTDVIRYALEYFKDQGAGFEHIMVLQPTCPLRSAFDISEAWKTYMASGKPFLVSIVKNDHPVYWSCGLDDNDVIRPVIPDKFLARSQDLPDTFMRNGAISIGRSEDFLNIGGFISEDTIGYVMPRERSIDIDDAVDLRLAEFMLSEIEE